MKALAALATTRERSIFEQDLEIGRAEIMQKTGGRRILVVGGAGSIGSSTIRELMKFNPACLHVVDQSENNLAELVRDIRNSQGKLQVEDFRTLPLDYGSPLMARFLGETPPYDVVLNFAALKHVRSEKDVCSSLQLIETNVLKLSRFLGWLIEKGGSQRFFSVSTDKAANPVNLMGATKRLMECVMFSGEIAGLGAIACTSARFANVAFSDGSLLHSFIQRLAKRQPLAVPRSTRRFFVSLEEAGQLCLIAAMCAAPSQTMIPRLEPDRDLRDLEAIARLFLEHHGLKAREYEDEELAKSALSADLAAGYYPLLLTPLDTSGEKPYEEFVGDGESSLETQFPNLAVVPFAPVLPGSVSGFISEMTATTQDHRMKIEKEQIINAVVKVVPAFMHVETGKTLDNRM